MKSFALIAATFGSFLIITQAGVPTQPPLPEGCRVPCIDGVFVLDISLSIESEANFQLMKDFVAETFSFVNISANCSRAALILFASDAFISFNLNEYITEGGLRNALDQIQLSDFNRRSVRTGTNTPAALDLLRVAAQNGSLGLSANNVHIALVMTDGRPNLRHIDRSIDQTEADQRTERAGNRLHQAGVFDQIYAVGIEGQHPIRDTLGFIAEPPSLAFTIAGFNQSVFTEARMNIAREFCNPCILTPCPTGSTCRICNETGLRYCVYSCGVDNGGCAEGSQCIELDVPTCNPGQCCSPVNITCQTCDVGKIDCVFVLDVSISINNDSNFGLVRDLVIQSAEQLAIGTNDALFSVILFARHAKINFTIPQHTDRASLINAINEISYFDTSEFNRTGTNIPEALDLLREGGQDGRIGLRSNTNFTHAIFITDGRPNTRDLVEEQLGERLNRSARQNLRILDEQNSIEAARRLHASGVYDDVFAIGIRGDRDINFVELDAIASRSELRFETQDFTQDAFQAVIQQLSEEICTPCTGFACPNGSICRECNKTGMPYCEFSCDISNGGCPQDTRCIETTTCLPGECCSPVITCETCTVAGRTDCVFVLDNSISIEDDVNFGLVRSVITRLADLVNVGEGDTEVLFSVIRFARHASISFPILQHTNRADLTEAVNQLSYFNLSRLDRTGTNIPEALDLLREGGQDGRIGLRNGSYRHAIFITDGRPNTRDLEEARLGRRLNRREAREHRILDEQNSIAAARRLHASGVYNDVFAIGIRAQRDINFVELDAIASHPEFRFEIQGFTQDTFEVVIQLLNEDLCDACTGFECRSGSTCRVCEQTGMAYCEYSCSINNGGCPEGSTCSETQNTCPPGQCCSSVNITCEVCEVNADFVYLLDVSISIGDDANFQEVTNFVSALGQVLEIGVNDNLAGVILFARHADIEFDVQEHTNAADFSTAVTSIIYSDIPRLNRTGTNIPEALDLLRTAGRRGGALRFRDDPDIPKIAVFMTDGRPNTRDLTGNSRQQDAINTQNAAARLHESGIYDQIYGIGIQGTREIDFVELRFIASDPGLVFEIADFEGELFEELQRNLTVSICRRQQCTIEGQVYLELAPPPECQPTCSNPMPSCPRLPLAPGCVCPEGTVIDQIRNRCVPITECTCPPQCSHQFCGSPLVQNSATLIPCMRGPPPYTEANCTDDCQLTYCQACYYYPRPLPPPPGCTYRNISKGCFCCLREWARCVEDRNRRDNTCTGDCQTEENFKCYDYHLCL